MIRAHLGSKKKNQNIRRQFLSGYNAHFWSSRMQDFDFEDEIEAAVNENDNNSNDSKPSSNFLSGVIKILLVCGLGYILFTWLKLNAFLKVEDIVLCLSPIKLCHNSDPPYLSNYGTVLWG